MQQFAYLIIVIASVFIPLLYSFHPKMRLIRWWKTILLAISLTAIPFIIWDIIFTKNSVWGFNPAYHLPVKLFSLPIEEWLFFWTIPYASIFTHFALHFYLPNFKLSKKIALYLGIFLLVIAFTLILFYNSRLYTLVNFIFFIFVLGFGLISNLKSLQSFFPSFIVILIPFLIVNGILTGSFNFETIVWYDNSENLSLRLFNIPIEDIAYAFTLLLSSLLLIEYINPINWNKKNRQNEF